MSNTESVDTLFQTSQPLRPTLFPTCLSVYLSHSGGPDHGEHGAPPPGPPAGRLPESHHPAGHTTDASWVSARLCPRAQGQHRIPAVAQLVCPDCQGKNVKGCFISCFTRCTIDWFGDWLIAWLDIWQAGRKVEGCF